MARRAKSGLEALEQVRRLLAPLLRSGSRTAKPVAEILDLLPIVEADLQRTAPKPAREYKSPKRYAVEEAREGERLAEYRAGSHVPLACPRRAYEAAAAVLAEATTAMDFVEMMDRIGERIGVRPGLSALRVATRFWMTSKPPLLLRVRARYQPLNRATFQADAERVWKKLAVGSK